MNFGATNQPSTGFGSLTSGFGSAATQPSTGTSLFGSSTTNQPTGFGTATQMPTTNLFGNTASTNLSNPTTSLTTGFGTATQQPQTSTFGNTGFNLGRDYLILNIYKFINLLIY